MQQVPQSSIHQGLLTALDWFIEIAKQHKLEYVLDGGCLLGATRNGKFIPWDDDIDITVSRSEFRRMADVLKTVQVPEEIEIFLPSQSAHILANPHSAKIRLRGVIGEEPNLMKRGITLEGMAHSGPAIDIVALDFVPKSMMAAKSLVKIARITSSIIRLKSVNKPLGSEVSSRFKALIYLVGLLPNFVVPRLNNYLERLQHGRISPLVCYSLGDNYPSVILKSSDFFPAKTIIFEGRMVAAPRESHNVLEGLYGADYIIPPSQKHQVNHFSNLRAIPGEPTFIREPEGS